MTTDIRWQQRFLLLPYSMDLSAFAQLSHPELREHIERVGQVFYQRP